MMCTQFPSLIFNREVYALAHGYSEILNPAFRPLVRQCFSNLKNRKLFKTRSTASEPTNPVYDLQYSPVSSRGSRMIAVGDEHGFLSVSTVPFSRNQGKNDEPGVERQAGSLRLMLGPYHRDVETDEIPVRDPDAINPVLYSLDWCACGNKIVTGYGDGSIRMWDLTKTSCYATIDAYTMSIKRVCWRNEAPTCVLSCSRTNEIEVHDLRMRVPLVNEINCSQLNCKLTDISVLDDNVLMSSSSNSSHTMLWDLRHTYKLYKRVMPVEKINVGGTGIINMKYDGVKYVYVLCVDGVIRKLDWRSGRVQSSFKSPSSVDYFTKIDVSESDVLVCGSTGTKAFGFDTNNSGEFVPPFFCLNEAGDEPKGQEEDKENEEGRSCCVVAIFKSRGACDVGYAQVATGGDDSGVTVWE